MSSMKYEYMIVYKNIMTNNIDRTKLVSYTKVKDYESLEKLDKELNEQLKKYSQHYSYIILYYKLLKSEVSYL